MTCGSPEHSVDALSPVHTTEVVESNLTATASTLPETETVTPKVSSSAVIGTPPVAVTQKTRAPPVSGDVNTPPVTVTPEVSSRPASTVPTPKASASRSPLSELLVLPACSTPKRKKDPPKSTHVLTSAQSLVTKRAEKERGAGRKRKEAKKAEMEVRKSEKEAEKQRKKEERERKKAEKGGGAGKGGGAASKPTKQYPKRRQAERRMLSLAAPAPRVTSVRYAVELIDDDGEVSADWIQCADDDCGVWSHVECLEREARGFVCATCFSVFK